MHVLVTGGTGVVGASTVRALVRHGHSVRVLSRHAGRGEPDWPSGVDGWAGDVANETSIRGSANGCDAVLHLAGIVEEAPPGRTFQSVNIDGTRYMVLEAERSGVRKFVYVSSLGAERGHSAYHTSKYVGEDVVRTFSRDWLVVRPGAVYGPGDEHVSVLLQLVRTLPVVPTVGDGEQKFQPVWHEDLSEALALAVERDDLRCATYEVAGPEETSQNDLVARFRAITGRGAIQASVPQVIASWGVRALQVVGIEPPVSDAQLSMLNEGNVIDPGGRNALTEVFGVAPTRLDDGLRWLAEDQPEQLPDEGIGDLRRKRFWVDLRGARLGTDELFEHLREHFGDLMPSLVQVKLESPAIAPLEEGQTVTMEIPVRGQIQVRVAEVMDRRITMLTVAGHPLAGAVRFLVDEENGAPRFEIQVYERSASTVDGIVMRTIGARLQRGVWTGMAQNVAKAAGSAAAEVQTEETTLDDQEASVVQEWAAELSGQLSRNSTSSGRD
jgi:NADH dehydrogenase